MNQEKRVRIGRNTKAIFWLAGVVGVLGILIYFEQIAILYILSTLAMIVFLLIVAYADLEDVEMEADKSTKHVKDSSEKIDDKSKEQESANRIAVSEFNVSDRDHEM
ncbi:MAG TPA: hypothetical protein PKD24_15045 [Pyrinomonadaceae bacterium]|nr:hypothetical protein [Pyrinomonadaceae bacterium]HMP66770.1 hypothetical protein [Pyrinomonadaceae bacterium]